MSSSSTVSCKYLGAWESSRVITQTREQMEKAMRDPVESDTQIRGRLIHQEMAGRRKPEGWLQDEVRALIQATTAQTRNQKKKLKKKRSK
jgi:hypothetical protein